MNRTDYDIKSLLDIPKWEPVQDQLAAATGTAIITIDFKGIPVTKHSLCTDFCNVIRANPVSRKRCYRCDSLAGLEAVRLNRPFIYLCHCGIVDVAIPVTVDGKYLGAVMFGQVRISSSDPDGKVERLVSEISSFQPESAQARQDLLEMYERIPEMEYDRIVAVADMIDAIVQYTVNRALDNHAQVLGYEWMLRETLPSVQNANLLRSAAEIEELPAVSSVPEDEKTAAAVPRGSAIYPAVMYIEHHRQEMISMHEMAQLCHLSASYFSKLFLREAGENFTDFVNRRKITWAKEQLRATADSITHIASELGYMDTSYFVKVFKKFEGITPLVYRQHRYR